MRRLRVLISSHQFSPYQGSECAVGWNIGTRMAAFHDVTLLCASGPPGGPDAYRNAVSDYVEKHGAIPGLRVVFVEQPPATLRYARMNSTDAGLLVAAPMVHGVGRMASRGLSCGTEPGTGELRHCSPTHTCQFRETRLLVDE
jgi:hypothetical protein